MVDYVVTTAEHVAATRLNARVQARDSAHFPAGLNCVEY